MKNSLCFKNKSLFWFALLGILLLWGCSQGDSESTKEETSESSRLGVEVSAFRFADGNARQTSSRRSIADLGEANAGSTAKINTETVTWNHVFGGSGNLVLTNTSTVDNLQTTDTLNMTDFALNGAKYTLSHGGYDVDLSMSETTPQPYVVVQASDQIFLNKNSTLTLSADTSYGLILLNPTHIDTTVLPVFTLGGTDYSFAQDQGYYYLYVPGGSSGYPDSQR